MSADTPDAEIELSTVESITGTQELSTVEQITGTGETSRMELSTVESITGTADESLLLREDSLLREDT